MLFELSRSSDAMVLKLEGPCTVEYAKEFKAALIEGLEKSDKVVVELGKVSEVDVSCLQLLYAALISCAESGKQVSLGANPPEEFTRIAKDTGYWEALGFPS